MKNYDEWWEEINCTSHLRNRGQSINTREAWKKGAEEEKEKTIDRIAFALFYQDYIWDNDIDNSLDYKEIESALKMWNQLISALNEPPWDNGKHMGDCTDVPITCTRCVIEEFFSKAKKILNINYDDMMKEIKDF